MSSEFIIPPHPIRHPENPVVFLAGPVQGTDNWQAEAADILLQSPVNMSIISPRGNQELYNAPSAWLERGEQNPWEKHHLRLARDTGVLAMWMAEQTYETPGRAYAQTSRIEFGRIAGWLDYKSDIKFVFGISPRYQGGNATYLQEVCAEHNISVQHDLGDWCLEIIERLQD